MPKHNNLYNKFKSTPKMFLYDVSNTWVPGGGMGASSKKAPQKEIMVLHIEKKGTPPHGEEGPYKEKKGPNMEKKPSHKKMKLV